jgi:site-specific DNA-methyltransferase (adenine-specific)
MSVDYRVGDVRTVLPTVADGSVSLVATSPPFVSLRSYLPDDHPHKADEIGNEPDPVTFVDTLLGLTAEFGRVLAPWGSIAVELGDTYSGSGGAGGDYTDGGIRAGQRKYKAQRKRGTWPRPKSLALAPQLYALGLAYGVQPLTGAPSPAGQWIVRNVIVWHRPNPAVGELTDKYRPSTSYIVVATRTPRRWFDLDAVRRVNPRTAERPKLGPKMAAASRGSGGDNGRPGHRVQQNEDGSPPQDYWHDEHDVWTHSPSTSTLPHNAMWPASLADRLVQSMCPREVCAECGEPRRRLVERTRTFGDVTPSAGRSSGGHDGAPMGASYTVTRRTVGWSDCGHGAFVPGVVLDPFAGTGTTLAVADLSGRDAVGIDLDEANAGLYETRRAECARALYGTRRQLPGQLGLFTEVSA